MSRILFLILAKTNFQSFLLCYAMQIGSPTRDMIHEFGPNSWTQNTAASGNSTRSRSNTLACNIIVPIILTTFTTAATAAVSTFITTTRTSTTTDTITSLLLPLITTPTTTRETTTTTTIKDMTYSDGK